MPTLGVFSCKLPESFIVICSDERVIEIMFRLFSISLDEQIERNFGSFRLVGDTGSGISGPVTLEAIFRDLLYLF